MDFAVSILSSLFILKNSLSLLLTFTCCYCLHLFVYIYARLLCQHLSSLKARLVSEHFGGNKSKIKRAAISQS